MGLWNAHDGSLLRMITVENRRDVGSLGNWALSPDGRWLAASVRGRRRHHRRQQDFIIWDLNTDELVYQTPKKKWKKSLMDEQTAPFYVDFSSDGRYLFTLKYKEFTVYEIVEKR